MNYMNDPRDFAPNDTVDTIEAEQGVLGALILYGDNVSGPLSFLTPDDFTEGAHKVIYTEARALLDRGRPVTPAALKSFLSGVDRIGDMTPGEYVARLAGEALPAGVVIPMARLLRDHAACRFGSARLEDATDLFRNRGAGDSVSEIADEVIDHMMAVKAMVPRGDDGSANAGAHVDRFLSRVFDRKASDVDYVPFPLPEFETVVQSGGWEPGNLYGLLAASGEGKTSLVLQAARAAMDAGHPTLILSFDQQGEQATMQMASQRCGISMRNITQFRTGAARETLNQTERDMLAAEAEILRGLPWYLCPLRDEKIGQIAKIAERFVKTWRKRIRADGSAYGTPLIILDHNRKVTPDDSRAHEGRIAGQINGAGKAMAGDLGAAVLFLNQRNGGGMRRDVPRPIAADLFGGEQAREDYDAILYLYRAERWMREKLKTAGSASEEAKIRERFLIDRRPPEGLAELGALKVRYGDDSVSEVLKWEGRFTRYSSERGGAQELFQ